VAAPRMPEACSTSPDFNFSCMLPVVELDWRGGSAATMVSLEDDQSHGKPRPFGGGNARDDHGCCATRRTDAAMNVTRISYCGQDRSLHRTFLRLTLTSEVLSAALPPLSTCQSLVPSSTRPNTGPTSSSHRDQSVAGRPAGRGWRHRRLRQSANRVVKACQDGEGNQMRTELNQAIGSAS
jgi:hypothetical protein